MRVFRVPSFLFSPVFRRMRSVMRLFQPAQVISMKIALWFRGNFLIGGLFFLAENQFPVPFARTLFDPPCATASNLHERCWSVVVALLDGRLPYKSPRPSTRSRSFYPQVLPTGHTVAVRVSHSHRRSPLHCIRVQRGGKKERRKTCTVR